MRRIFLCAWLRAHMRLEQAQPGSRDAGVVPGILMMLVLGTAWRATAEEGITPFLPGISVGLPIASAPLPGAYFTNSYGTFSTELRDGSGRPTGVRTSELNLVYQLQWVLPWKVLGASVEGSVAQPLRWAVMDGSGAHSDKFGLLNTVVSPLNLSWNLGNNFYTSSGITFYPGLSKRSVYSAVGRGYATAELDLGLSYLPKGWNISVHPVFDINSQNQATRYRSGSIYLMDYTLMHRRGQVEFGVGGTVVQQFTDDRRGGVPVPRITGLNGRGNRASSISFGPTIAYHIGKTEVSAYVLQDLYSTNFSGGLHVWLQASLPF